jgi:hypothetical protein
VIQAETATASWDSPPAPQSLPPLPPLVRYWDDFAEKTRSVRDIRNLSVIEFVCDGRQSFWDLSDLRAASAILLKHTFCWLIGRRDPSTVRLYMERIVGMLRRTDAAILEQLAWRPPHEVRCKWDMELYPLFDNVIVADSFKRVLHSFCAASIGHWRPEFSDYVSKFRVPPTDVYRSVKSGECFVPAEHQQLFYEALDQLAARAHETTYDAVEQLRAAAIAALIDQHAFRPGTISRLKQADVRSFEGGALHIAAVVIKKQDGTERRRITRRIRREWVPIFTAFGRLRDHLPRLRDTPFENFFALTPDGVSQAVMEFMKQSTGDRWTATDLRHTAAQRLVDAGASADQLAEFMTHTSRMSGLVYYDQSPTQAHRINQALAVSPTYAAVVEVHRTKTIDKMALLGLPDDQQIGGVPHGIALAGIGACSLGQLLCPKNPVLSCYGCRKFLAVSDPDVHDDVVDKLRPVVLEFEAAARGHDISPAFTQLRRTLVSAQAIARELREGTPHE